MRFRPYRLLALLATMTFGSLLTTAGFAWYLRSDAYRATCVATLETHLGLPCQIERIVPRSTTSREFRGVRVWLPQRRDEAAFVERALVVRDPTPDNPDAYRLDLLDGWCEISTRTWLREDYRFMLESGLRPGFHPDGPRRVILSRMRLAFDRDRFRGTLEDASGVVSFEDPHRGRAVVTCTALNNVRPTQPVTLHAEFSPHTTGIRLDQITLTVPRLPVRALGLEELAAVPVPDASFEGRLVYAETEIDRALTLAGSVYDVQLAEITAPYFPRPWRGRAPVLELRELAVRDQRPERARIRGRLEDVVLGDILAPWGLGGVGGDLVLHVSTAELSPDGVERLILSGRCEHIDLAELSQALGRGRMTGRARLVIDDLTIVANRLASLDAEISVEPIDDPLNWIERDLVSHVVQQTLGFALPEFLPERFEYTQLGVRLMVRDEVLYVLGTHGPREQTILTVRVGAQDLGVVREPAEPYNLGPWFDTLRARAFTFVRRRLDDVSPQKAWRALSEHVPPASLESSAEEP